MLPENPKQNSVAFEAAAYGINPETLEKGRQYIQYLIDIDVAKKIIGIDPNNQKVEVTEHRNPGEETATYKRETINQGKFLGIMMPIEDTEQVIVILNSDLKMGLYSIKKTDIDYLITKRDKILKSISDFQVEYYQGKTDVLYEINSNYFFNLESSSDRNPELLISELSKLIPKIIEKRDKYQENRNTAANKFNRIMSEIFGD